MGKKKAFTLIELLVVIAIIALLLSILVPSLRKVKDAAKTIVCASNLRQIGVAASSYAESNDQFIPRAELSSVDFSDSNPFTGNWQIAFSPYIGGGEGFQGYWEVEAYNCPSYPDKEQTMDFIMNAWKYDIDNLDGLERRGFMKITNVRNRVGIVYLSDYAYYEFLPNSSGILEATGEKAGDHIRIITGEMIETWTPEELYLEMRWMDVWAKPHLTPAGNSRRVSYSRHKKEGTNNLFLDGHVGWMHTDDQVPKRWRVRE